MTSNESGNRHSTIGITMGDPAGIGPEIVLKALAGSARRGIRILGSKRVFVQEQQRLGTSIDAVRAVDDVAGDIGGFSMGRPQENCGQAALRCLELGVELLNKGEIDALVTAPVSKEALRLAGFKWPGQTEFLAQSLGSASYAMLAWTPKFKVVLVTTHLPLEQVSRHITAQLVAEKAVLLDRFLRTEGVVKPRVAVMALNPHAAEFSQGEEDRILEGIRLAQRAGVDASGPFPADALFARVREFDGHVAMYHDQAMIPAKLLGKGAGVNVTLGLSRVRTSPLHGVAFDIAGTGRAKATSMRAAIRLALRLVKLRQ